MNSAAGPRNAPTGNVDTTPGNSPLTDPPADYCPPGAAKWFTLPDGENAGAKIFFADYQIGDGEPEATVVLVHGNPECSYSYRHVVNELGSLATKPLRIVVMDHIGFGLSDQATFEMIDMHQAHNLRRLVEHLDLRGITLVVHDWGGPIGIGALLLENHTRVKNLVVLNTTVFPLPKDGLNFTNFPVPWRRLSWHASPDLFPSSIWGTWAAIAVHATPGSTPKLFYNTLKNFARAVLGLAPDSWNVYKTMLSTKANANSSKRFVRHTKSWGHGYTYKTSIGTVDNRAFYQRIQSEIGEKWGPKGGNIPIRMLFGSWDPLAQPSVIEQWTEALPQLRGNIQVFADTSHFVAEHKGPEIAQAIIDVNGL
ncbi:alpha/beta fold hydrolase [Nocardia sp. CNY236]|uniref:alpha/beta fold hydrolase n=1 Tax=Nocardia sp. CNY236 TaxID=1169152 RepID=UPI0012DFDD12|nr:alpha/beta fold hydrolase [Nocardia sp. CNY236]